MFFQKNESKKFQREGNINIARNLLELMIKKDIANKGNSLYFYKEFTIGSYLEKSNSLPDIIRNYIDKVSAKLYLSQQERTTFFLKAVSEVSNLLFGYNEEARNQATI